MSFAVVILINAHGGQFMTLYASNIHPHFVYAGSQGLGGSDKNNLHIGFQKHINIKFYIYWPRWWLLLKPIGRD